MILTGMKEELNDKLKHLEKEMQKTDSLSPEDIAQYESQIKAVQKSIIGNLTKKISEQQALVLAGIQWETKILEGGWKGKQSPKQIFHQLKVHDPDIGPCITQAQWLEHCSELANLD